MIDRDFVDEHLALIAVAAACWQGSQSWHVLGWMAYRLRCKYPLVPRNSVINLDSTCT